MNILEKELAKAGYIRVGEALVFFKRNVTWGDRIVDHVLTCPDKVGLWDVWERPDWVDASTNLQPSPSEMILRCWDSSYCLPELFDFFVYDCMSQYYFFKDAEKSKEYQYLADEIKNELKNKQTCRLSPNKCG